MSAKFNNDKKAVVELRAIEGEVDGSFAEGKLQSFIPFKQGVKRVAVFASSFAWLSFLIIVAIPTVLASLYLTILASNKYTSEFRVSVRSAGALTGGAGLTQLLGISGLSQSGADSNSIVQYLQSRQAVDDLNNSVHLRTLYSDPDIDFWARLSDRSKAEDEVYYWNKMLDAYYESTTGTIVVKVTAFSPKAAFDIASSALKLSEDLVNRMSSRQRDDAVKSAASAVQSTKENMDDISRRLQAYRDSKGIVDPRLTGETIEKLSAELQAEILKTSTNLASSQKYLSPDAPSVQQQASYLSALKSALQKVQDEATSKNDQTGDNGQNAPLSNVLGMFQQLESDQLFAEKAYETALAAEESAKLDAVRQQVYLSTIVQPDLPEEKTFPKPLRDIPTVFFLLVFGWLIILFGFVSVREHL